MRKLIRLMSGARLFRVFKEAHCICHHLPSKQFQNCALKMYSHLKSLTLLSTFVAPLFSHSIPPSYGDHVSKALYFLENDPAGAKLVAAGVKSDGSLGDVTETSALGSGLQAVSETDGTLLGPDSLVGAGAVAIGKGDEGEEYVFTVNAGSNTLAMFKISPFDPLHPQLVGKPVDTLGEFPQSVTYSSKLKTGMPMSTALYLQAQR
jgi:hypothetical protein